MNIHSRAERAAGREEKRTKGVGNCTGNTKVREKEEKREEKVVHCGVVIHASAHRAGRYT